MNKTEHPLQLNDEQLKAITHGQGPLLIIAGAGTGKTTVITERIKWLIEQKKAKPSEILALTFTEKAASEMQERVDITLPLGYTQTWIATFHSFCEQLLREDAIHIGLDPNFRILSEAETYLFVREHLFEFDLKYFRPLGNATKFISGLITHFSRLKDEDISPEEHSRYIESLKNSKVQISNSKQIQISKSQVPNKVDEEEIEKEAELASAYQTYEKLKIKYSVMDFADLISNTLKLFRQRLNVLQKYQKQFKYILVDEFQDTNYAQNELAKLLSADDQNITAVLDDDQSIYRWRGAAIYNVMDFRKHYPKAKIITLIRNYRSFQNLLDHAYHFIQNNNPDRLEIKERIDKKLQAVRGKNKEDVKIIWEEKVEDEAETVVAEIIKLTSANANSQALPQSKIPLRGTNSQPLEFKDFAILVRANNHAAPFVQALARHNIPYQFLGPGQLYHQSEIKDLIAYLKVLYNFEDNVAMYRVLNMEHFTFDPRDIAAIINFARKNNLSLFETLEKLENQTTKGSDKQKKSDHPIIRLSSYPKNLKPETHRKAKKLVDIIHQHLALVPNKTPGQILYYFLKNTGILKKFAQVTSSKDEKEVQNISRFFDKIKSFETQNPEAKLSDFIEYLDFVISQGESPLASQIDWLEENAVNILTIHSAKGLEFPVVFMVNLVDQRFPTRGRGEQIPIPEKLIKESLPQGDPHLQEERRLFYVGMTRAKDRIYFTGAKFYGENRRPKKLSPFIQEALGENLEPFIVRFKKDKAPTLFDWADLEPKEKKQEKKEEIKRAPIDFLSYSQINTFEICPLQYKYKYILRIPVPQSAAVSFGNAMHQTLRDFYKALKEGAKLKLDNLHEILENHWSSEGFENKMHEQKRKEEGKAALSKYYKNYHDEKKLPIFLEYPFKIKLENLTIGGYIDRIDKLSDNKVEIIDYKTGKVYGENQMKNDLQLTIYALAISQPAILNKSLDQQRLSFYFFETGEKKTTQRGKKEVTNAKKEIVGTAEKINQSNFEPTPSLMCEYCEYKLLCPAYRGKT